ncbi:MAG: hypothetical protein IMZ61_08990 [Planctomycetes bacterium]|nr:hypothetical protein [Planctomycetota bacterium]
MTKNDVAKDDPLTTQANVQGLKTLQVNKGGGPVGNNKAFKHGGEAAVRAITRGDPFRGLAADELQAVEAAYQAEGVPPLVVMNSLRLQVAANLYWNAICKAAEGGDLLLLDRYVQRFGWLAGVALRALEQVATQQKAAGKGGVSARDVIEAIERAALTEPRAKDVQNDPGL